MRGCSGCGRGDPVTVTIGGEAITLYTRAEAAALLGVTERTMTDYVRRGRIATILLNRHRLIPAWALKEYLTAGNRRPRRDGGRMDSSGGMDGGEDLLSWENRETLL